MLADTLDRLRVDLEKNISQVPAGPELSSPAPVRHGPKHAATPRLGTDFSHLWSATLASNLSDGIRQAALPLLVASLTRDPAKVAGVAFAAQAPWLLFGLAGGAIVDRVERRRLIGLAHLFRMAVVGLLAVSALMGMASITLIYIAAFLLGTAETLFDNASQVIVPELVDERHLELANGRQAMAIVTGQQLLGPVLGAALFGMALAAPLVIDAVALCLAALFVLRIKTRPTPPPAATTTIRRDISEGLSWLVRHRTLRTISLGSALVNIAVMAHTAVFVLFSLEVLGVGGLGFALILSCYAVGGIAGGLIAPKAAAWLTPRWAVVAALVVAAASIGITGMTSSPLVAAAMQVTLAVAGSVWGVVTGSLRQRITPNGMLGRVTGTHQLMSWGGGALGAVLGGVLASSMGLRAPFLVGGLVLAGVAMVFAVGGLERESAPAPAAWTLAPSSA